VTVGLIGQHIAQRACDVNRLPAHIRFVKQEALTAVSEWAHGVAISEVGGV
jgi:hypothetical protein